MPQGGSSPTPLRWPNSFVRVSRSAIGSGGASSQAMFARTLLGQIRTCRLTNHNQPAFLWARTVPDSRGTSPTMTED